MEHNIIDKNLSPVIKKPLPNSAATLVLGIISIVFGCCYGTGLPMAIIALAISGKSVKMHKENPDLYSGFENLNAGRICAIIGLCISSLFAIFIIAYLIFMGSLLSMSDIWNDFY